MCTSAAEMPTVVGTEITDLSSDNNGSPEGPQKQLELSTDFEFYMKVGGLVFPSVSRTTKVTILGP